jgi:hypothetical protein
MLRKHAAQAEAKGSIPAIHEQHKLHGEMRAAVLLLTFCGVSSSSLRWLPAHRSKQVVKWEGHAGQGLCAVEVELIPALGMKSTGPAPRSSET